MNLSIQEVHDKNLWENFLLNSHPNTFLQSWNWGVFNDALGRKIFRLGLFEGGILKGIALVIKYSTQLGSYLYSPRGPVLKWDDHQLFDTFVDKIVEIAKQEEAIFIKIDPLLEDTTENREFFQTRNFKKAVTFVQVEYAWLLDLDKTEDELLSEMRKTTRYLIRHEPKQGVKVEMSADLEDIEKFTDMLYSTAARKNFVNHPKKYYVKQFEILSKENQMRIFKATKKGKVLAMAVIAFYGDMAYYLHGASVENAQNAGYPIQWEAIKEAKKRGLKTYNFWGVVKDKSFNPSHPWYGFSLFKKGFGGYKYSYIRAQDLPLSPRYWVYRYIEKSRRLLNRVKNGYWED